MEIGDGVMNMDSLRFELDGRFQAVAREIGKVHISVRFEPLPAVARVGAMLENYDWDNRMRTLRVLREFERVHVDEFALEYDIVPLEAVTDATFAEA